MGPLVAGEDTSQESMGNSALLAPESPGVAELLQVANRSLAAPGEPGDQARMLEAPRPPGEAEPSPSVDGKKQVRGPSGECEPGPRHAAEHSLRQACVRAPAEFPPQSPGLL